MWDFSFLLFFPVKNKLILVKFLYNSYKIPAFQRLFWNTESLFSGSRGFGGKRNGSLIAC
jgi:flagellar biosynthesis protein FliR